MYFTSEDGLQFVFTETIFVGNITDVRVLFQGNGKGTVRNWHIRVNRALDDAVAEIESYGVDSSDVTRSMASDVVSPMKGRKRCSLRRYLPLHLASCHGPDPDRSVLARGAAMDMGILHTHQVGVYTSEKKYPHLDGVTVQTAIWECLLFPSFRATHPKQSHTLGMNNTVKCEAVLRKFFCRGTASQGNKMSGAMMCVALLQKFQPPYDIALEQHINGMIQGLFLEVVSSPVSIASSPYSADRQC